MPSYDYKNAPVKENHYCYQEARLSTIETKLQNKKENLHEVHEDYYHLREKLELISENVVELTTIMKDAKDKEKRNEEKIDELKEEILNANMKIEKMDSSIGTLKYIIGLVIPILCVIIPLIINYLIK